MKWYIKVLKQCAEFDGRAQRKEYWMFMLINLIIAIIAMVLDYFLDLKIDDSNYGPIFSLYSIAMIIPFLSVTVRRLHDLGKNGLMVLIGLLPLIGIIWLMVLMAKAGDIDPNEYGDNPIKMNHT